MLQIIHNILGEATFSEKLLDSITVTVVGMGIVILALLLMGKIFQLLGHLLTPPPQVEDGLKRVPTATTGASDFKPDPKSIDLGYTDPKLIVILAAAATAASGRRVRVRRITFINHNTVSGWAEAGRISIQTSHNIRRK
jgi:Na+-transporting methylmalonyl-CoA/oxaloacetate decarboxylase gamma subunit